MMSVNSPAPSGKPGAPQNIDEVYFFRLLDGRIVDLWGIEDTTERMRQLGLS